MVDRAFAEVLKKLRIRKGLSQEAFGFEVGIHRTYVSQLERGLKSPSLRVLHRISEVLGVKLSRMMAMTERQLAARRKTR